MHQLGKTHPALLISVINMNMSGEIQVASGNADWTLEKLVILWPKLLAHAVSRGLIITLVLDGFDEISHQNQEAFLDCLQACEDSLSTQLRRNLRIIIFARSCASLHQEDREFVRYEITEGDVEQDIRCTVKWDLKLFAKQAKYSEEFQEKLCDTVTQGAKGVYLWATVMMEDIRIWMPGEHQLERRLRQLPQSLAELYDYILGNIKLQGSNYAVRTRRVLLWVIFCLEPLRLQELNVGITMAELLEEDPSRRVDEALIHSTMTPPHVFGAALTLLCGQLLRLSSNGHVEPVHRTLSQYLTERLETIKGAHRGWVVPNHEHFYMQADVSHAALASMCAAYLTMPPFESSGEPFKATKERRARWEIKIQERLKSHTLVQYSALCWTKHLSLAGSVPGIDDRTRHNCASLRGTKTQFAISWFEVWWYERRWRDLDFPGGRVDPESFLAQNVGNSLVPKIGGQTPAELGLGITEHQLQSSDTLVEAGEGAEEQVVVFQPTQPPTHRTPMSQSVPGDSRNSASGSSEIPGTSHREREASNNPLHHEQRVIHAHTYTEHRNHTTITIQPVYHQ
jgi:hypothetical protein